MTLAVVRIGNSRGVRLPKAILEQCQIADEVEVNVVEGKLVMVPPTRPREGWEAAARRMRAAGGDELLIPDAFADDAVLPWE